MLFYPGNVLLLSPGPKENVTACGAMGRLITALARCSIYFQLYFALLIWGADHAPSIFEAHQLNLLRIAAASFAILLALPLEIMLGASTLPPPRRRCLSLSARFISICRMP